MDSETILNVMAAAFDFDLSAGGFWGVIYNICRVCIWAWFSWLCVVWMMFEPGYFHKYKKGDDWFGDSLAEENKWRAELEEYRRLKEAKTKKGGVIK